MSRYALRTLLLQWTCCAVLALAGCESSDAPTGEIQRAAPAGDDFGPAHALATPAAPGSAEAHLAASRDGQVVLSWIEPDGDGNALEFARLDGSAWSAAQLAQRGTDWVVSAADLPAVEPVTAELWAAHWRVAQREDPYAYDIAFAVSTDAGRSWGEPQLLNDDATPTEHGFVSVFAWDADIGVVWLDGRDTASDAVSAVPLGTSVRFARVAADARVVAQGVVDGLACDCCRTGVVTTPAGLVVAYRDRTPEEIRDVVVRRRAAAEWSEPMAVGADHWRIEGCPVNGPVIAARAADVAVAWFTAPDDRPSVRVAFSRDGGETFGTALVVDGAAALGQVGVVLLDSGAAVVSWWRHGATGGAELAARRVSAAGELGTVRVVATSPASRPDDVPQMIRARERLVFAWTELGRPSRVATAYFELR